ncbi:type 1 glutamine amidotransferase [Nocardioides sp. Root151]|uniref:type 1 glutamine amidotransferase n=1 Tax=Nocardioides sp. Root151 TaxID=1736475 RepID=UPI000B1C7A2E|nr:type 1 glutamine amidotransferase [Nocardioides sp. Root151]
MTTPCIVAIEHEAMCPPGHLGAWLSEAGAEVEVCRPYVGDALPDLAAYDALVVLGGTMGADDDAAYWWLPPLKHLVRDAADTGVPTLGICLGHQLVAVALGGGVEVNPRGQQVGVLPVGWLPAAAQDRVFGRPHGLRGIQWNNDIVSELPDGAVLLAATPDDEVQVVRFADSVWGVQLHPEADEQIVAAWADGDREAHLARGLDQTALIGSIADARAELDAAWRPMAEHFTQLARERMDRRQTGDGSARTGDGSAG